MQGCKVLGCPSMASVTGYCDLHYNLNRAAQNIVDEIKVNSADEIYVDHKIRTDNTPYYEIGIVRHFLWIERKVPCYLVYKREQAQESVGDIIAYVANKVSETRAAPMLVSSSRMAL